MLVFMSTQGYSILLPWTCPCLSSVDCFHSRNKLIRRGRVSWVKQEQSCQNQRRNSQKPPSNQRSWKHRSSLPPLITASPTSKCLRVRSGSLAGVLQAVENVASWALRRLCVNVGAKAVQTVIMLLPYSGEVLKEINLGHVSLASLSWFGTRILKLSPKGIVDSYFACFLCRESHLFNWTPGTARQGRFDSIVPSIYWKASSALKRLFCFLACGRLQ